MSMSFEMINFEKTDKAMNRIKYIIVALVVLCSTEASVAQRISRQGYVDLYKQWAINEMNRVGIPASITLAQGILESDCGNSDLATEGNNHFGIKCHSDWTGDTMYHDDDREQECFRKYTSAYDSFKDHSDFIKQKSRYASLFLLEKTDYKGWARGLRAAGYATDPNYPDKLITIIEEMGLDTYDTGDAVTSAENAYDYTYDVNAGKVVKNDGDNVSKVKVKRDATFTINPFHEHEVEYNNGVKYIAVIDGDSFEGIAREFHLMVSELLAYNDLDATADIKAIKYLYIRPKKNRAHPDCLTYVVKEGDTLWSISHKYGMKLRKLRKFNHIAIGEEVNVGDELNLRRSK